MSIPATVVRSTSRLAEWGDKSRGINAYWMRVAYAKAGTLPHDPEFMATKLVVKRFSMRGHEKAIREVATQRILELVMPAMAVPIVRSRGEDGRAKDEVVMRWVKGCPDTAYYRAYKAVPARTPQQELEYGAMSLFDIMVDNADRHDGNFVRTRDHIHAIDHENSFYEPMNVEDRKYRIQNITNMQQLTGCILFIQNARRRLSSLARLVTVGASTITDVYNRPKGGRYTAKDVESFLDAYEDCCLRSWRRFRESDHLT